MRKLKTISVLSALFWCMALMSFAGTNWSALGPGGGGNIYNIAIDPTNPDVVFLGTQNSGIYKSTDGGNTWEPGGNGIVFPASTANNYGIQEIVIDPVNTNNVWAASFQGLFKSTDGGNTWNYAFEEPYGSETPAVSSIAIDPTNNDNIWVGVGDKINNSGGKGQVFKSTDGGNTWNVVTTGMDATAIVNSIVVDPTSPANNRTLFISTNKGIYRSTDGGNVWQPADNGLPHIQTTSLKPVEEPGGNFSVFATLKSQGDPADPLTYKGGIWKSTDGGNTWNSVMGDLPITASCAGCDPAYFDWKFAVDFEEPNTMFAATFSNVNADNAGVYKSTDGGNIWLRVDNSSSVNFGWQDDTWSGNWNVWSLAIAPGNTNNIWTASAWLHKSTDGGNTWNQVYTEELNGAFKGTGLQQLEVFDMVFDPSNNSTIWAGFNEMGLWKSTDGGNYWRAVDSKQNPFEEPGGNYDNALQIEIDPKNGDLFIARNGGDTEDRSSNFDGGNIWKSTDGGNVWNKLEAAGLPNGRPNFVMDPTEEPGGNRTLYVASHSNGVYKSTDGGNTWNAINNGLSLDAQDAWDIEIDTEEPSRLWLGTNSLDGTGGGLWKSTDGGNVWTQVANAPAGDILDVTLNVEEPGEEPAIYIGITDSYGMSSTGGLYKSTDGGNTWNKVLDQPRVSNLVASPADPKLLLAVSQQWWVNVPGQNAGLWKSTDGGNTWESITGDLPHLFIESVIFDPTSNSKIYVGTRGGGMWSADISTSINDVIDFADGIKVYPNPFSESATIELGDMITTPVNLKIYDQLGRTVRTVNKFSGRTITINKGELSEGVYHYTIDTEATVIGNGKLIVH